MSNLAISRARLGLGRLPAVDAGPPPARLRSAGGGLPGYAPGFRAMVGNPARDAVLTLTSERKVG
jgi:hypothetical protein